jgi:anti-sigma factor RsiW
VVASERLRGSQPLLPLDGGTALSGRAILRAVDAGEGLSTRCLKMASNFSNATDTLYVFVWPAADGADSGAELSTRQGCNLVHWTKSGMTYWALSDLNSAELQELTRLIQERRPASPQSR